MSILKVEELIRLFLKNPLSSIPVIDKNQKEDCFLIGFLSRNKVFHYSVDKNRIEQSFEFIPDFFISRDISPEVIWEFFEKAPIPVIDLYAKLQTNWNRPEINFYIKNFLYTVNLDKKKDVKNSEENQELHEKYNLIENILSAFPLPLFATDHKGHHILYNEDFIREILEKGPFKKKMAIAESYLYEQTRKTLAENILNQHYSDLMEFFIKELNKKVIVRNLTRNQELYGYLYVFLEAEKKLDIISIYEDYLHKGLTYEEIIVEIEKKIIGFYLDKYNQNITHTSEKLKIKRTTLQNKIKRIFQDNKKEIPEISENKNKERQSRSNSKKSKKIK